jgi:hypothetical protein
MMLTKKKNPKLFKLLQLCPHYTEEFAETVQDSARRLCTVAGGNL